MIWLILALAVLSLLCTVLASPFALVLLLKPALQAVDGGSRKPAHVAAAVVAWVADLVAAHTVWAWFIGGLHPGEKTISDTLERLAQHNMLDPDYLLYRELALFINRKSPTGRHIKAVI